MIESEGFTWRSGAAPVKVWTSYQAEKEIRISSTVFVERRALWKVKNWEEDPWEEGTGRGGNK